MLELIDSINDEFGVPIQNSTNINAETVINILKNVFDPDIHYSIYDMGLIYNIEITNTDINILMTLTSPSCPSAQSLPEEVHDKTQFQFPNHKVSVTITFEPAWTIENMAEYVKIGLRLI